MTTALRSSTPGVYYQAVDAGGPAVTPLRTDITGFAGLAERGPIDLPVPVTSWRQFVSWFGDVIPAGFLAYAVRGFFDNGVQADWVHIDDIDSYDALYFAYPIMLTREQANKLAAWVERGGRLVSEACPAYFGDRGHVGTVQPNMGLDEVFGAREEEVEFMPDIGDRIHFKLDSLAVDGGGLLQSYRLTGGNGRGRFHDGRLAVVENSFGKGRTLLIGTNPSVTYYRTQGEANGEFFAELVRWSGRSRHVTLSNPAVFARIHKGEKGSFLWLVNPTRTPQVTEVALAEGRLSGSRPAWRMEMSSGTGSIEIWESSIGAPVWSRARRTATKMALPASIFSSDAVSSSAIAGMYWSSAWTTVRPNWTTIRCSVCWDGRTHARRARRSWRRCMVICFWPATPMSKAWHWMAMCANSTCCGPTV